MNTIRIVGLTSDCPRPHLVTLVSLCLHVSDAEAVAALKAATPASPVVVKVEGPRRAWVKRFFSFGARLA